VRMHLIEIMANGRPTDFVCPECEARYKLVHAHSPAPPAAASVQCMACGHSFASADGE
jgi:predicted Zn finger-like uncharacterized protein